MHLGRDIGAIPPFRVEGVPGQRPSPMYLVDLGRGGVHWFPAEGLTLEASASTPDARACRHPGRPGWWLLPRGLKKKSRRTPPPHRRAFFSADQASQNAFPLELVPP